MKVMVRYTDSSVGGSSAMNSLRGDHRDQERQDDPQQHEEQADWR